MASTGGEWAEQNRQEAARREPSSFQPEPEAPMSARQMERQGKVPVCCKQFATATHAGADGEGYGALLYMVTHGSTKMPEHQRWHIGTVRPSIQEIHFCPWCGAAVNQEAGANDTPRGEPDV